jgi:Ribosomal protein S8
MLTDPIADYLTRIRNALGSGHDEVEIPASRLKLEMSRILKEQGYIRDFSKEPAKVGEAIKIRLKYTEDRRPGEDLPPRPAPLRRPQARAPRRRRHGYRDRQHLGWRDDRPRGQAERRRRRGGRLHLVSEP